MQTYQDIWKGCKFLQIRTERMPKLMEYSQYSEHDLRQLVPSEYDIRITAPME